MQSFGSFSKHAETEHALFEESNNFSLLVLLLQKIYPFVCICVRVTLYLRGCVCMEGMWVCVRACVH